MAEIHGDWHCRLCQMPLARRRDPGWVRRRVLLVLDPQVVIVTCHGAPAMRLPFLAALPLCLGRPNGGGAAAGWGVVLRGVNGGSIV